MRARDNPFTATRIHGLRFRFSPDMSMELLLQRLHRRGMRGALVGGTGRGKSTLLGELGSRLAGAGFLVRRVTLRRAPARIVRARAQGIEGLGERVALLVDGAEQLSVLDWLLLARRARAAGAFVVTSHRPGRLPTLMRCETSPGVLGELLDELAPRRPASFPSAAALWRAHGGDARQALFAAYDAWARQPFKGS